MQPTPRFVVVAILAACCATNAVAQCGTSALPGAAVPGPATGKIHASIAWDPDGSGPLPERLVIGGDFTMPSIRTSHIASYDFATGDWQPLGLGVSHRVSAFAVLPNGHLVATGQFLTAGGTNAFCIARWDGANWHPIGNGLPGGGNAVVVMPNGDLVVGCWSGTGLPNLVRWDGSAWTQFAGYVDGEVTTLAVAQNGDLYAGGAFVFAGGVFCSRVGRWDGTTWHHLAFGVLGTVSRIALRPNGELIVGGNFGTVGFPQVSALRIASWNGTAWSPLAGGSNLSITALRTLGNGDVIAAGEFSAPGVPLFNLGRWDGTQWAPVGSGTTYAWSPWTVPALALEEMASGDLIAAGEFGSCDHVIVGRVARRSGTTWSALGTGPDQRVRSLAVDDHGDLHVGGDFEIAGGDSIRALARVHGGVWQQPAANEYFGPVETIVRLANGQLAATTFGGYDQRSIAIWDGQAWTATTAKVNYDVHAIAQMPSGEVVIGGSFTSGTGMLCCHRVARLAGNSWQGLGSEYINNPVRALLPLDNGDLVAGGDFTRVDAVDVGHVARWNGTAWMPMGTGLGMNYYDTARCLARLPNGEIVAAGTFTFPGSPAANHIARFDGTAWLPLGSGLAGGHGPTGVRALLVLPNGDLLVGGDFATAGGVPVRGLARWNGSAWSAVDPGVDGVVYAMTMLPDGDLLVGGDFARAGTTVSGHLARIRSGCVAAVANVGAGCANALGTVALAARDLPWLGGTYRATCDQVPAGALGFAVRGFGQVAVPLSLYHPAAGPGCQQFASMDSVVWLFAEGNRVTSSLPIPVAAGLLGMQLLDQVVLAELSGALAVTGITSSNAVRLTIGAFY